MPYRNVGTPRFFVNVMEWGDANGISLAMHNAYRTLPVYPKTYSTTLEDSNGNPN